MAVVRIKIRKIRGIQLVSARSVRHNYSVIRGHTIRLTVTPEQESYLARAAGTARFAYNWALAAWNDVYELQKIDASITGTSEMELRRELNRIKEQAYPWMLEVTKCAPQMAIKNLGKAFANFFKGIAKHPQFKVKGRDDRFTVSNDHVEIKEKQIRLPHIGWIPMREQLRFQGKILSATISKVAGKWYASIAVEVTALQLQPAKNHGKVGIDLGVNTLATLWKDNGISKKIKAKRPLKDLLPKLKQLSRSLSRKIKRSKSWEKAKLQLARLHARIANIRKDRTHKITSLISRHYAIVVIEDLDVRGMMQGSNRGLRRSVADMAFGEFRRQLTYKMEARGSELIVVDRYYPSSKTCSCCTTVNPKLKRGDTIWTCSVCNTTHDRDVNAAHNLWNVNP
jgi:putative transposase